MENLNSFPDLFYEDVFSNTNRHFKMCAKWVEGLATINY